MEPFFPSGLKIVYPYDTTPFVKISIHEVVKTLVEAIILVFLVMYLFLQNFRATLIPTIAVPVVLLGTFAILAVWLLDKHPDDVRDGARHRPAGG
jgi:multidrug efflux pump